jgi:mono/diheme cytochrome c family protein
MQPFGLLSESELDALAAAATHLAVRGEVEFRLLRALATDPPDDLAAEAAAVTAKVLARWTTPPLTVPPAPTPARDDDEFTPGHQDSVRRGYELFAGKAGCLNCHQDFGRAERWLYDAWGTAARVTDLTAGEFRGGSTPDDLFKRVRLGVPAAGMPANPALSDAEVWDLVHFVRAASKPARLPTDVKAKVYPGGGDR